METILDDDDCWDIVMGTKLEPNDLAVAVDAHEVEDGSGGGSRLGT